MEKNAAAGRTPSSVPMPTPPPSALNLSSPRFAPLSLVHTNSLNDANSVNTRVDPTNFSLPPSYTEDDRSSLNVMASRGPIPVQSEDQRNDRFPSGGLYLLHFQFTIIFISDYCIHFVLILCY